MAEPAFVLRGVGLAGRGGETILEGIDWSLARGSTGVVVGASGAGKSRLLRLLNRLDEPTGEVVVLGTPLAAWSPGELRRRVGWVPQRPVLEHGTVRHALEAPARLGLLARHDLDQRWSRALDVSRVPATSVDRQTSRLSGGEALRVALARALLIEPTILLLDEPTSALDGALGAEVLTNLRAFADERDMTLVVATHRIEDLRRLAGELLVLAAGRAVRRGPSLDVLADPSGFDVAALLTGRAEVAD